jgi:hypothetical protein
MKNKSVPKLTAAEQAKVQEFFGAVAACDHQEIRDFLTQYPNLVHAINKIGDTALNAAAGSGTREDLETVKILMSYGADETAQNFRGVTPIHAAGRIDDIPLMREFFLAMGIDVAPEADRILGLNNNVDSVKEADAYLSRPDIVKSNKHLREMEKAGADEGCCIIMKAEIDHQVPAFLSHLFGHPAPFLNMDQEKELHKFTAGLNQIVSFNPEIEAMRYGIFSLNSASDFLSLVVIPKEFNSYSLEQLEYFIAGVVNYFSASEGS